MSANVAVEIQARHCAPLAELLPGFGAPWPSQAQERGNISTFNLPAAARVPDVGTTIQCAPATARHRMSLRRPVPVLCLSLRVVRLGVGEAGGRLPVVESLAIRQVGDSISPSRISPSNATQERRQ